MCKFNIRVWMACSSSTTTIADEKDLDFVSYLLSTEFLDLNLKW